MRCDRVAGGDSRRQVPPSNSSPAYQAVEAAIWLTGRASLNKAENR